MSFSPYRFAAPLLAAGAVTVGSILFVVGHTREDSLSADEPVHILSGHLMATTGNAIVNIEHPPLMKLLAGVAVAALPISPPPKEIPLGQAFTGYGRTFFFRNGVSADAIIAAARSPFLLVFGALLLLVFFVARSRCGNGAALFATALLAFDPTLVAHAGVVHTDLGAALAFLVGVLAWERARRSPSPGRLAVAALVLGLAFVTKFSTVYLAPILLIQTLLALRAERRSGRDALRSLGGLLAVGVGAIVVTCLVYLPVTRGTDRAEQREVIHEMVARQGGAPGLSASVERLTSVSRPLAHYAGGLASVLQQNVVGGTVTFLRGKLSVTGFPGYFFIAFLVKSTLAVLAVTAIALLGSFRDPRWREDARLFLVPVLVLFITSVNSSYNIGIRHMLPVYPLLVLAGAGVMDRWRRKGPRPARTVVAVWVLLAVVTLAELVAIHPHELSYFNPLVGGPDGGRKILSDSNIDWGLDLKRLANELSRRGERNPTVVYFGGDDVGERVGVPNFVTEPGVRGRLVAFSAVHLVMGPEFYAYRNAPAAGAAIAALRREVLARGRPVGRVGHSIYLFELPLATPGGKRESPQ